MSINKPGHFLRPLFAGVLILLNSVRPGAAQTTAFTYQGVLQSGGAPAYGAYDLKFTCYNAATGGELIGGAITNAAVGVSGGLFTTTLNFGSGVFIGGNVWLEIAVRVAASNSFTTLAPRQPVTVAPYALYALTAGTSLTQSNATTGAVIVNSNGVLVTPSSFFPANSNSLNSVISSTYVTNNSSGVTLSGSFSGALSGALSTNVTVTQAQISPALSNTYQQTAGQSLQISTAGNEVNNIFSSNNVVGGGGNGSTLFLNHMGEYGYADIGFFTTGYNPAVYLNQYAYNLQFALGCTDPGSAYFPYAGGPFLELYNSAVQSFNFVHYGYGSSGNGFIGGVRSNAFYWSLDGTTNNDAFCVYPPGAGAGIAAISNNLQTFFKSNLTVGAGGTINGNGSGITALNAGNLSSGMVPAARMGAGTASSSTFLRGDQTWAAITGGGAVTAMSVTVTNSLILLTNAPFPSALAGARMFATSNYDLYWVTPTKTNLVALGH